MPTLAEFRFLAGRLHTTPWGSHVNEGVVEWPPAPWRLLRALLATWYLKATDDVPVAVLRSLVGKLAAQPPRYQLPDASTGHTRHYMPFNEGKNEKTTKIFDTFVALRKDAPLIVCWDVELSSEERTALGTLLGRLAYLGRAESLVEAQLLPANEIARFRGDASPLADGEALAPGAGYIRLLTPLSEPAYVVWLSELTTTLAQPATPTAGKRGKTKKATAPVAPEDLFAALHADTGELQASGWLGEPPGARQLYYTRPERSLDPAPAQSQGTRFRPGSRLPTVGRYAIASNVLPRITAALSVGERVHQALLSRFKDRQPPPVLLGRSASGEPLTGHGHAHIFCEPGSTKQDSIAHVTVYASDGFDVEAQRALRSLGRIWGHGGHDIELVLIDLGGAETFSDSLLFKPSKVWESLTPFVSTRHPKTYRDGRPKIGPDGWQTDSPEHEIRRWLSRHPTATSAAFPLPTKIEPLPAPSCKSRPLRWHDFGTQRHQGGGIRAQQPARGFRLTFPEPVSGPLALGYAAHFGLGLFMPVS